MRKRHNYKNLKIWKLGLVIVHDVSNLLLSFPKNEQYSLTSQINRSAVSMPSNIAEGSARSDRAFLVFLDYAIGSSFELGTQLIIAQYRNYITQEQLTEIEKKLVEWQKMTMSFQNGLELELNKSTINNKDSINLNPNKEDDNIQEHP